ncbi:hypothetical protein GGF44_006628, partial [Coemansia sp. RSA 1694]
DARRRAQLPGHPAPHGQHRRRRAGRGALRRGAVAGQPRHPPPAAARRGAVPARQAGHGQPERRRGRARVGAARRAAVRLPPHAAAAPAPRGLCRRRAGADAGAAALPAPAAGARQAHGQPHGGALGARAAPGADRANAAAGVRRRAGRHHGRPGADQPPLGPAARARAADGADRRAGRRPRRGPLPRAGRRRRRGHGAPADRGWPSRLFAHPRPKRASVAAQGVAARPRRPADPRAPVRRVHDGHARRRPGRVRRAGDGARVVAARHPLPGGVPGVPAAARRAGQDKDGLQQPGPGLWPVVLAQPGQRPQGRLCRLLCRAVV